MNSIDLAEGMAVEALLKSRFEDRLFYWGFQVTNIYVGNLSFRATEDDIRDAFAQYGQVSLVNIVVDKETGRSRGFAFVEMPNSDEANAAIENVNQQEIASRRVSVNEARPREDRPPRGPRHGTGTDRSERVGDSSNDRSGARAPRRSYPRENHGE